MSRSMHSWLNLVCCKIQAAQRSHMTVMVEGLWMTMGKSGHYNIPGWMALCDILQRTDEVP